MYSENDSISVSQVYQNKHFPAPIGHWTLDKACGYEGEEDRVLAESTQGHMRENKYL